MSPQGDGTGAKYFGFDTNLMQGRKMFSRRGDFSWRQVNGQGNR